MSEAQGDGDEQPADRFRGCILSGSGARVARIGCQGQRGVMVACRQVRGNRVASAERANSFRAGETAVGS